MDQTTRRFPAHAVIPRATTARTPTGETGSDVPPQSSAGRSVIAAAAVNTERFISTASKRSISFFWKSVNAAEKKPERTNSAVAPMPSPNMPETGLPFHAMTATPRMHIPVPSHCRALAFSRRRNREKRSVNTVCIGQMTILP